MSRIVFFFLIFIKISYSQVYPIKGKVLSEGSPLQGASVIISGTKIGTLTNQEGDFTLNISKIKNPKIIISYIGHKSFSQKISYDIKNMGSFELELDDRLNEVVISGTLKPVSKLNSPVPVEVYTKEFFKGNPTASVFESMGSCLEVVVIASFEIKRFRTSVDPIYMSVHLCTCVCRSVRLCVAFVCRLCIAFVLFLLV